MLHLLLLLPLLQTDYAEPPVSQGPPVSPETGILLAPRGVQAPDQPTARSSATYTSTERRDAPATRPQLGRIETPISSLVAVRGQEDNAIGGMGLVIGLAGTGDSSDLAKQLQQNLLRTQNLTIDLQALSSKNTAVVWVSAILPAGIKPGRAIDVTVSSIGDAKSLQGGLLLTTELTDLAGTTVYATASGPLTVGGFAIEGAAASVQRNHVTVGVLPGGGKVERVAETQIVSDHGYLYLDARTGQDSFGNMVRIADAINAMFPGVAAILPDAKTVRVDVPRDLPETAYVSFLDTILRREIVSDNRARVVINERTGVIVMGGDVRLRPGAIAHGNLTVTIAETREVSQPGPLSAGRTEGVDRTDLAVEQEDNPLVLIPGAVTLQEVVDVLNVMGATPRDLIGILAAMSDGGLLVAEIRRM